METPGRGNTWGAHNLKSAVPPTRNSLSMSAPGFKLGGNSTGITLARMAQDRQNAAQVVRHKEQEWEKRKKKLEEKLDRNPYLNSVTSPGKNVGKSSLTLAEIREIQNQQNEEKIKAFKLKQLEEAAKRQEQPSQHNF